MIYLVFKLLLLGFIQGLVMDYPVWKKYSDITDFSSAVIIYHRIFRQTGQVPCIKDQAITFLDHVRHPKLSAVVELCSEQAAAYFPDDNELAESLSANLQKQVKHCAWLVVPK